MKFSYLLINFLTIFFPIVLSFDKRVAFFKSWRFIFPALLITGLLFLFWDYLFTIYGVWSFNPEYIIGFNILNLPIEEILFFITVPFACIFVYECLNYYVKTDLLKRFSSPISYILITFSGLMVVLYYDRVYSLITFGLLAVVLIITEFIVKSTIMSRFYLAYLVSLIPFYLVNGLLTSIPIVMYNDAENMAIRVGTIPLEDHFYSLSMLLINILLFDYFRKKGTLAK
jgi:lycopene cyclase domain-containing protein